MNDLPAIPTETPAQDLTAHSLEILRATAWKRIEWNLGLSEEQKRNAKRELDFLIEHERLRRVRQARMQYHQERAEMAREAIMRREEMVNRIRIERARTRREIVRMNRDIASYKLEILAQLNKLRPDNRAIKEAHEQLLKLRVQQKMSRARERDLLRSLETQTLKRAAFLKRVRRDFPDQAEELIDHYDQMSYQRGQRR